MARTKNQIAQEATTKETHKVRKKPAKLNFVQQNAERQTDGLVKQSAGGLVRYVLFSTFFL